MEKRKHIGFFLSVCVLFAILFQSFHATEHLISQLTTEQCFHEHKDGNAEFTHQHHGHDKCFVCEYSFSGFIYSEIYSIDYPRIEITSVQITSKQEAYQFSTLNLRLVRGPPINIV